MVKAKDIIAPIYNIRIQPAQDSISKDQASSPCPVVFTPYPIPDVPQRHGFGLQEPPRVITVPDQDLWDTSEEGLDLRQGKMRTVGSDKSRE